MPTKRAQPSKLEDALYKLLAQALQRAECAAKASAQIEFDLVQKHLEQQAPPTTEAADEFDEEEQPSQVAEQASREFDAAQFQGVFGNLNMLRMVIDLLDLLKLDQVKDDVLRTLIREMFSMRTSAAPRQGAEETFVGTDIDLLFHRLRQLAERKQRNNS